jgi:hypothetical protein
MYVAGFDCCLPRGVKKVRFHLNSWDVILLGWFDLLATDNFIALSLTIRVCEQQAMPVWLF